MARTFPDLASNTFGSRTFVQVIDDFRSLGLEVKVTIAPFPREATGSTATAADTETVGAGVSGATTEGTSASAPEANAEATNAGLSVRSGIRIFGVTCRSPWTDAGVGPHLVGPLISPESQATPPAPAQASHGAEHSVIALDDAELDEEEIPYYVVTAGRKVGVFQDCAEASSYVSGVSHGYYKHHKNLDAANKAFQKALDEDRVVILH